MINTAVKKKAKRVKQNTGKEEMFHNSPKTTTNDQGPSANKMKADYNLKVKKKKKNQTKTPFKAVKLAFLRPEYHLPIYVLLIHQAS